MTAKTPIEGDLSTRLVKVDTGCSHLLVKQSLYKSLPGGLSAVIFEIEGSEFEVPVSHLIFTAQPGHQHVERVGPLPGSFELGNEETVSCTDYGADINMGVAVLSAFGGVVFESVAGSSAVGFLPFR